VYNKINRNNLKHDTSLEFRGVSGCTACRLQRITYNHGRRGLLRGRIAQAGALQGISATATQPIHHVLDFFSKTGLVVLQHFFAIDQKEGVVATALGKEQNGSHELLKICCSPRNP